MKSLPKIEAVIYNLWLRALIFKMIYIYILNRIILLTFLNYEKAKGELVKRDEI